GRRAAERTAGLHVAVGLLPAPRNAATQPIGERATERAFEAVRGKLRAARFDVAIQLLVGRAMREEVDEPTRRVTAEQRTLRPAQDLDAVHVEELRVDRVHACDVRAVDVYGDRRFEVVLEVGLRYAAQAENRECRRPCGELQRRNLLRDGRGIRDTQVLEL